MLNNSACVVIFDLTSDKPLPKAIAKRLKISGVLLIKKNFEFHRRSGAGGSDNFSGYHDRFWGFGKSKGHGYLLSDGQWFCGFNKNSGTTYVLNRCIEFRARSFATYDDGLVFFK